MPSRWGALRILLGLALTAYVVPVYFRVDLPLAFRTLLLVLGLIGHAAYARLVRRLAGGNVALVGPDSRCAVCDGPVDRKQGFFATSGVFLPLEHPLFRFCDAPIHWDCYAVWPHRAEFAQARFQTHVRSERLNPYWGLAYLSERVAVTVNPDLPVQEVAIVLADTGTTLRVPLTAWQSWCAGLPATCAAENALVRQAIETVMMELKHELPRAEILVNRVDWATKRLLLAEESERERHSEQARLRTPLA